jgi:hypothetical protein
MSEFWWSCKTCGDDFFDSSAVHLHRRETGHNGAALVTDDVPPPATSTEAARRKALEDTAAAIAEVKLRRTTVEKDET